MFLSWPTRVLASRDSRPLNVLFIIADDLGKTSDLDFLNCTYTLICYNFSTIIGDGYMAGYNDVPWHNPDIIAPYLDNIAKSGIIMENHYAQQICTPTR